MLSTLHPPGRSDLGCQANQLNQTKITDINISRNIVYWDLYDQIKHGWLWPLTHNYQISKMYFINIEGPTIVLVVALKL